MFNDEQRAYMASLAALPPEAKCACGWYVRGECGRCPVESGGIDICKSAHPRWPRLTCSAKRGHADQCQTYEHNTGTLQRWTP